MCCASDRNDNFSNIGDAEAFTPNTSTASKFERVEICPEPGGTFVLSTINTNRILVLKYGQLCLAEEPTEAYGSLWQCVEKDGWLGFRNTVSGTYIGHNNCRPRSPKEGISYTWRFQGSASKHTDCEFLQVRRHRSGGYSLWVKHYDKLFPMAADPKGVDDGVFVDTNGRNWITWEFLEPEPPSCTVM